jgi:hypothetical protein
VAKNGAKRRVRSSWNWLDPLIGSSPGERESRRRGNPGVPPRARA